MSIRDRKSTIRIQLATAIILLLVGVFLFIVREDFYKFYAIAPALLLPIVIACLFIGVAILLLLYLRGDISIGPIERIASINDPDPGGGTILSELSRLRSELMEIKAKAGTSQTTSAMLSPDDRESFISALRPLIAGDLLAELENRYSAAAIENSLVAQVRQIFSLNSARLRQEISYLGRKGNLNLVIGVLTTALAVGLLAYMVLGVDHKFVDLIELLSYYIPRVTTVVFIEVFSFFFLKLYKSNLGEIKYYQNELTNLAVQEIGLETARLTKEPSSLRLVVEALVKDDRNSSEVVPKAEGKISQKELIGVLEQLVKVVGKSAEKGAGD